MKLYLIWQRENQNYDTYDELVVVSESPENAVLIRPDSSTWDEAKDEPHDSWVNDPKYVQVKEIGIANEDYKEGDIVCYSFNAG